MHGTAKAQGGRLFMHSFLHFCIWRVRGACLGWPPGGRSAKTKSLKKGAQKGAKTKNHHACKNIYSQSNMQLSNNSCISALVAIIPGWGISESQGIISRPCSFMYSYPESKYSQIRRSLDGGQLYQEAIQVSSHTHIIACIYVSLLLSLFFLPCSIFLAFHAWGFHWISVDQSHLLMLIMVYQFVYTAFLPGSV